MRQCARAAPPHRGELNDVRSEALWFSVRRAEGTSVVIEVLAAGLGKGAAKTTVAPKTRRQWVLDSNENSRLIGGADKLDEECKELKDIAEMDVHKSYN